MNDKRLTKSYKLHNEPQSSHYLVVHEDAHLSYKWYKVEKFCFKGHPRYTSTSTHEHTIFVFFIFFPFFTESNKQNKQKSISKINKTRLTQNNKNTQEMQDKWMNHLKESFSFQTRDLKGEEVFFF